MRKIRSGLFGRIVLAILGFTPESAPVARAS